MATIRKRATGNWEARVRKQGYPERDRTFDTRAEAEAWARSVESEMDRGLWRNTASAERTTLAEACDRYRREVFPILKDGGVGEQARLDRLANRLGAYALATLGPNHVAEFREARLQEEAAPQTVKHELGLLNRILRAAAGEWGIPFPHGLPTANVRNPRLPGGRERRLEVGEEDLLLEAARLKQVAVGPAIVLGLETAMRRGELAALRWEHVDLRARTAHLPDTKNGQARRVPLSSRAVETLEALPGPLVGSVLGLSKDKLSKHFHGTRNPKDPRSVVRIARELSLERGGVEMAHLTFHDLRHEATSRFFEKTDLDLMEIASITGHRNLQALKRYTHLRAGDLARRLG